MRDSQRLHRLRWGTITCPLIRPYDLSFVQLAAFDSVWVLAEDEEGRIGLGEAVPLPGYSWETLATIRSTVAELVAGGDRESIARIVERCRGARAHHPFAASAVMTALGMASFLDHADSATRFTLSAPVSAEWPLLDLRRTVESYLAAGYEFIKCKVGRDYDRDIAAARCLLSEFPGRKFGVVFDANQAYTPDIALAFARDLHNCASERLQWLEQPVDRLDWEGMARVCRNSNVPVVLDECIYSEAEVARAATIGAHGVKLKLTKNFGLHETLFLARRAHDLGLIVVFGNGVATDIGNLGEYLVLAAADGLFTAPCECSGFTKLREPLLGSLLKVDERGRFSCPGGRASIEERVSGLVAQWLG